MSELSPALAALAADALLALHAGVVLFVVGGLGYVWVGWHRGWAGTRSRAWRGAHLAAIGIVAAQAWLGRLCPLTVWEMALRQRAGQATYGESFVAHWLGQLLYWDLPLWALALAYSVFSLAVLVKTVA